MTNETLLNELGPAGSTALSDLVGNWFLYTMSVFMELAIVCVTAMFIYNKSKDLLKTRSFTRRTDPINLNKWKNLCICLTLFLRAVMDAVVLIVWDEVTIGTLQSLITADRILTIISAVPFTAFAYLLFRSGPSIDFQLLRQPIPTDMNATWPMVRKPVIVLIIMVVLSFMITITKS